MGGLFGAAGPKTTPVRYAGMQVSASLLGQVIPWIAGRQRVPLNLGWYGNFKSQAANGGGKSGGGAATSYTYSSSWIGLICLGPIQGFHQVYYDQSQTTLAAQNLSFALGASGQATWTGYPSGTPAGQKIPYDRQAYVATPSFNLGSSPALPNFTFEIEGLVPGYSDAHGVFDADPSAVWLTYLTDPVVGSGFQGTIQTLTGTSNSYQAYCMALGLVTSPYETSQRAATDFSKELLQITNSDMVLSCGTLKIIPYADQPVSGTTPDGVNWSYTPNLTPIYSFTDSDYAPKKGDPPVVLTRKAQTDIFNIINLNYNDRSNFYNNSPASASDLNDIQIRGPKAGTTLAFPQITQASVAKTVAQLILQFQLYERNSLEWRVRADYSLLEPMDYVAVTEANLGLVNQVVRLTSVQDDGDSYITLKGMIVPGAVRSTPQYNWSAAQGYAANFDEAPLSVNAPLIFQMPNIPGALSEGITVGIAVNGQTADTAWGGCDVWMSADGGSNYYWVGVVGPFGTPRYGTISSNVTAVADPDITTTMGVTLNNTTQQIDTAVTHAMADDNQTMILVGAGSTAEIMSFGTAALVSAGHYNLSYLRRNLYQSANQAHTSGAPFARLDGAIFQIALDPGAAGKTLFFKFTSFNTVGRAEQDISAATAYSYVVPVATNNNFPVPLTARGNCVLTGTTAYKAATATNAWDSDVVTANAYPALTATAYYGSLGSGSSASLGFGLAFATSIATVGTHPGQAGAYGFLVTGTGGGQIFEQGNLVASFTATVGDEYKLLYDGFQISYLQNGNPLHVTPLMGQQLYASLPFESAGATLGSVSVLASSQATPAQWKVGPNVFATDDHMTLFQGGTVWGPGNYAYTAQGYSTCHIRFKLSTPSLDGPLVGLATAANVASASSYTGATIYALVDYAWNNDGANWRIYESGANVANFNAPTITDVVWITYDGSNVRYYLNDPTTAVRTVAVSGLTLYGLATFDINGSGINSIDYGPTTNLSVWDTGQLGTNAATEIYSASLPGPSTSGTQVGVFAVTVAVPAIPYAHTAIITMTCDAWKSSGGGIWVERDLHGSTSGGITSEERFLTQTASPGERVTIQYEFPNVAGVAYDYTLQFNTLSPSNTITVQNVRAQVEIIKR